MILGRAGVIYDEFVAMLVHRIQAARKAAVDSTKRLLNSSPPRSKNFLAAFAKV